MSSIISLTNFSLHLVKSISSILNKNLPLLTIVEDNNLSILTEKKVRRNWEMDDVAKSFKMYGFSVNDDPLELLKYSEYFFKKPCLLNVNTHRIYWHAGAGKDSEDTFDRYKDEINKLGDEANKFDEKIKREMENLWKKQLEK